MATADAQTSLIAELRELIVGAAPQPELAQAVLTCDAAAPLDRLMPFSSVIILGVLVAIEDRFGIVTTKSDLKTAVAGGATLERLAEMIRARLSESAPRKSGPLVPVRGRGTHSDGSGLG